MYIRIDNEISINHNSYINDDENYEHRIGRSTHFQYGITNRQGQYHYGSIERIPQLHLADSVKGHNHGRTENLGKTE